MTDLQITCDNCGAKYKLPASFTGSQAKCQKCGSVIDVQKQRAAAAGPSPAAAAKPAAAARPAIDRSKQAPAPTSKPAAAPTAGSASSARRGKDAADAPASGGKRERPERGERAKAKSSPMPMLMAGLGLLVIGGGAAFFLTRGEDKPATQTTAKNDSAAATPAAANPAPAQPEAPKPDAAKPDAAKADAAKTDTPPPAGDAKPATTEPAKPPEAAPAEASAPAVPDDPTRVKKPWEKLRNPPQSMDQVADPKSYGEVTWPQGIEAAKQTEVAGGGRPGIKAKPKLVQIGYPAMFGIVEKLRTLDYKSAEQSQLAFEFNKVLEDITGGLNARFEPVEATEELVAAKAEWNTRSVKGWLDLLGKFPDEDAFKKDKAARLAKQADK
jgi:hypothetical protein